MQDTPHNEAEPNVKTTDKSDRQSNDTSPKVSTSRRDVLIGLGAGGLLATTGVVGTAMAQEESPANSKIPFDTSFDPRDEEAVAGFVAETCEWSNQVSDQAASTQDAEQSIRAQRKNVLDELSDPQLDAVTEVLKEVEIVVEQSSDAATREPSATVPGNVATDQIGIASCNNYGDHVEGYFYIPYVGNTVLAFDFEHDVGWCVSNNEVINVTPSSQGNAQSYVLINWDYQGLSDQSLTYHPDNYYAISYRKGMYNRCLITSSGISCVSTDYGWVELAVYNDRNGVTLDTGVEG